MIIGIIDADLISNIRNHRFPNLACMKISGWHKTKGDDVELILNYDDINPLHYDIIYISKVFTDTQVPDSLLHLSNVQYGGTGFFYDNAPPLPYEIEHHFPDYDLYNDWVSLSIEKGEKESNFTYYKDCSIGYTTRGCVRQCPFCVNRNKKSIDLHSPVEEFLDDSKKFICLLDDNILMSKNWKEVLLSLQKTGKPFQYKQGMDERALTEEKIKLLLDVSYFGDYIFAFDNIEDKDIIVRKLELWKSLDKKHTRLKFYVLCGYDRNDVWDKSFWIKDIADTFERVRILMEYGALPYIMRYQRVYTSDYKDIYTYLASWCNQPSLFKSMTFETYCKKKGIQQKHYNEYKNNLEAYENTIGVLGKSWRTLNFLKTLPISNLNHYLSMKW